MKLIYCIIAGVNGSAWLSDMGTAIHKHVLTPIAFGGDENDTRLQKLRHLIEQKRQHIKSLTEKLNEVNPTTHYDEFERYASEKEAAEASLTVLVAEEVRLAKEAPRVVAHEARAARPSDGVAQTGHDAFPMHGQVPQKARAARPSDGIATAGPAEWSAIRHGDGSGTSPHTGALRIARAAQPSDGVAASEY